MKLCAERGWDPEGVYTMDTPLGQEACLEYAKVLGVQIIETMTTLVTDEDGQPEGVEVVETDLTHELGGAHAPSFRAGLEPC
jgi:hypothetical protein